MGGVEIDWAHRAENKVQDRKGVTVCRKELIHFQKQPSIGVFRERCSENMQQIYTRTSMPKCDFNKVALQLF